MDDLGGILAGNYGFRPQGKAAPMAASKPSNLGTPNRPRSGWDSTDSWLGDSRSPPAYDDLLGGSSSFTKQGQSATVDSILEGFENLGGSSSASSSMPVFDKPLYDDDDMFDGVPGMRSSGAAAAPFDVFESISSGSKRAAAPQYDDLLENLGRGVPQKEGDERGSGDRKRPDANDFDELIPGFGGSSPPKRRESPEINQAHFSASSAKATAEKADDPFIVLESASTSGVSSSGMYTDPLEHISRANSGSNKVDTSSASRGFFDETDSFIGLQSSMPTFKNEKHENIQDKSPSIDAQNVNTEFQFSGKEPLRQSPSDAFDDILPKMQASKTPNSEKIAGTNNFYSSEAYRTNSMEDQSPKSDEHSEAENDAWLTVSEIPLYTQPTSAPPPSRPPPPLVIKQTSFGPNAKTRDNESFSQSTDYIDKDKMHRSFVSPLDEFEDFAMGKPQVYAQNRTDNISNEEEFEAKVAAANMKDAMDRAEAKFKHAKEFREREAKSKEYMQQDRDEKTTVDEQDFEDQENQDRFDWEQEQREREEREKEAKRLQKERELELERGRERERARQAVERATREARERAAAEARQRAERAAVEKAALEARQRAERAAVQRAAAEARERAATEARERVAAEAREKAARERAAAEARERADREKSERAAVERAAAEARIRAERAAVERAGAEARERAAAEARERAAAEARERAAAAAREKQQKPEDDLESFFGMGARATSAPRARATTVESMFDVQTQSKGSSDGTRRASSTSSSNIRKASSATNIVDDLSSIFGGPPSSGEFQDIEGESDERRRARLERHQRTLERAAKALAEKNERDMQTQREQAERHRISETLDFEIKRWAAGKEGNLRALLSTLQYILWPECGWQPVSLTDLITGAAVKKVYRKATLCIHPDKVQQKGANLQQKYVAEKVFDLLKEAWNKFNSEELF